MTKSAALYDDLGCFAELLPSMSVSINNDDVHKKVDVRTNMSQSHCTDSKESPLNTRTSMLKEETGISCPKH